MPPANHRFREPFPIVTCEDLSGVLSFYRDHLGFRPTYRFPDDGDPLFVALTLDGSSLGLTSSTFPPIHGRAVSTTGSGFELCVATDDVDAATAELRGRGVPVVVDPLDQPWGERVAYVEDPDGRLVLLTGPARS